MEKIDNLQGEIARVAYDFYLQRGIIDGYDVDDWLQAEKIVMVQYSKSRNKKKETSNVRKKR